MKKIALVARREFVATAGTRGFVVGLLIMPAIIAAAAIVGPRIISSPAPQVRGDVAIVDPTGVVAAELRDTVAPEAIAARRTENVRRTVAAGPMGQGAAQPAVAERAIEAVVGEVPQIRVVETAPGGDVQREKDWLLAGSEAARHLALIVVHDDAVAPAADRPQFGSYDIFVSRSLEDATEAVIHESMREALIGSRLRASNLDRRAIEATMQVARPTSVIVGEDGEQQAQRPFTRALPLILGILIFMGVMIGGQTLMTSTIEEKSSRVVEVLLAAVSPFELMAGKLLGQLGVGLLVLSLYLGLGLLTLYSFTMLGLIDPMLVVFLLVFFLITYLVFGALMTAIGAAVNQMADAQSLMGPVMILLVFPYILSPAIGRAPNSTFSVAVSFIPPINTFAMLSRIASDSPPPAWQIWLTALIGLATACAAVWFAGKVFKVGLLMHGKPPNLATLIRWARAA